MRRGLFTTMAVPVVAAMLGVAAPALAQTAAGARKKVEKPAAHEAKEKPGDKEDDSESNVKMQDLPQAVRATVERETKNATLKRIAKEKENGKTVYELETLVNGRTRDLTIDTAGTVGVVEEQLDANQAPAPVRAALQAQGTIVALETVVENGKTTYEGQVKTKAGKSVTMELDANGKALKK
ncbi:MAG: PepSY domain-containing protein [Vicinamibacterales bacterium]